MGVRCAVSVHVCVLRPAIRVGADARTAWVECPYCKAKNPNTTMPEENSSLLGRWAFGGTVLILLSLFGALVGPFVVAFVDYFRHEGTIDKTRSIVTLGGFAILLVVGILLVIAGTQSATEVIRKGAVLIKVAAVLTVVALSALIYGFSVCFY
jgi:hypothetical protein